MHCPRCKTEAAADTRYCGTCGSPLATAPGASGVTRTYQMNPPQELPTGGFFAGRYQIIEELGKGGMGRVYKVFDDKIKEKIALKLLKPEISADEEAIERFRNELRLSRRISHRHVCRMFDLGEFEGAHYITMEYVSGEDLKSVLRMMGAMGAGKAALIGRQVCEGLAEAHRLGVVHRDLKPQNIMIDREGGVRIMDFGIARSLKVKGLTGAGVVIGTPEYMSPEQIEGQEVDGRSDIYSLGVILFEMAAGRVPFEGESFLGIAVKQKTVAPRKPSAFNPQIPVELDRVILRCLEKSPDRRYQKVEDLQADLAAIEQGFPTTEKVLPGGKSSTARKIKVKLRPRKLAAAAALVLGLAAAAVLGVRIFSGRAAVPGTSKPSLAVMDFENNTGDAGLDHWRRALPELVITDLSQSRYVRVLPGDQLYEILENLNQIEARTYSASTLRNVVTQSGVNHVLVGSLTKSGDAFRLSYTLKEYGSGETIGTGWVGGKGVDGFYPMIDALTLKIKEDLKLTRAEIAGDYDTDLGKITASSTEAFLLYVEGRERHLKGDYAASISKMQEAVALDPGFVMAYRSMAMSYNNSLLYEESRKYLRKAQAASSRVSERERLLIEAEYLGSDWRTAPQAIGVYKKILNMYPGDPFAGTKLAAIFLNFEMWEDVLRYGQDAARNGERAYFVYSYVAQAYIALGRIDQARRFIAAYLRDIGDSGSLRTFLSDCDLYEGRFREAAEEIERAIVASPESARCRMARANLFLYQNQFPRAQEEILNVRRIRDPAALGYSVYQEICLDILRGKFREAGALAEQGIQTTIAMNARATANYFRLLASYVLWRTGLGAEAVQGCERILEYAAAPNYPYWQRTALRLKGLIEVSLNRPDQAARTAEALTAAIKADINPTARKWPEHLDSALELHKNNAAAAAARLEKTAGLWHHEAVFSEDAHALFINTLAEAYEQTGDLARARKEYEKITALTAGRYAFGDIYVKAFYRLGRIAEQKGQKDEAVRNYAKFLELWKEADPGIPEIPEAEKRWAALRAGR